MRRMLVLMVVLMMPCVSLANITSKEYVDTKISGVVGAVEQQIEEKTATKVDTSSTANQTMAGSYTVSGSFTVTGSFKVPTPPLPNPDAE